MQQVDWSSPPSMTACSSADGARAQFQHSELQEQEL
jgi:hypothetical protein